MNKYYEFIAPYDKFQLSEPLKIVYTSTIEEAVRKGVGCYKWIYEPVNITRDSMEEDKNNGVKIIGLKRRNGDVIYIPSKYLKEKTNVDNVLYAYKKIGIDLGELPIELDLSNLLNDIKILIENRVGILTTPLVVEAGIPHAYTRDDHNQKEALRLNRVVNKYNYLQQLVTANQRINDLETIKEQYECGIHECPPTQ